LCNVCTREFERQRRACSGLLAALRAAARGPGPGASGPTRALLSSARCEAYSVTSDGGRHFSLTDGLRHGANHPTGATSVRLRSEVLLHGVSLRCVGAWRGQTNRCVAAALEVSRDLLMLLPSSHGAKRAPARSRHGGMMSVAVEACHKSRNAPSAKVMSVDRSKALCMHMYMCMCM